jgi:6-phosphogluconolactonase
LTTHIASGLRRAVATAAAAVGLATAGGASAATWVYIANADSQDISVLELDRAEGVLKPIETVAVGGTVMPLAISPDKRFLYAALRSQPYRVVSFAIDSATGKLRKLGEAPLADSMANIDTDRTGKWLFAASFPGHKITVNSIGADGQAGAIQQLIPTAPNAHAIHADAGNRFVLATSLGGDNISAWRFDAAAGRLSAHEPALTGFAPKAGPRHLVWDQPQRRAYVIDELDAAVHVLAWDSTAGTLKPLQTTTALPTGFTGKPWAADLHLRPDGRFLYASERTSSTISAYKVDAGTGLLQALGQTPTEKTPRGFAIDSSGRYLIATGQESHSVSVHPIDAETGALGSPKRLAVGKNPNWVAVVDLP